MRQRLLVVALAIFAVTSVGNQVPGGADASGPEVPGADGPPATRTETIKTGFAKGQLARVVPYVGLPGVDAGVAVSQAEVSGPRSRATAGLTDFGRLGGLLLNAGGSLVPVPTPQLPAPLSADSDYDADLERDPLITVVQSGAPDGTPPPPALPVPVGAKEEAHANKEPASRAGVRLAGLATPGLTEIAQGETAANATPAASSAKVTIGRIVLGGGAAPAVVLTDLVWQADQGEGKPGTATFTIGSANVAGQPVDLGGPEGAAAALTAANQALEPAGLHLEAPKTQMDTGVATMSPLVLEARVPAAAGSAIAPAVEAIKPAFGQLLDTLLAAYPGGEASRLVVNALLAGATGQNGGRLELGGVTARVGSTDITIPLLPPPPQLAPAPDLGSGAAPAAGASNPAAAPVAAAPPLPPAAPAASFDRLPAPTYNDYLPPDQTLGAAPAPGTTNLAPGGNPLAAQPLKASEQPGGAPAPLVLGTAILTALILAGGDRLRLRRLAPDAYAGGPA